MKNLIDVKRKLTIVATGIVLFLALQNIQVTTESQSKSNIDLLGVSVSTAIPSASACWEIYGWSCQYTDICGHVPGFMCYWDSWNGFKPCRSN